MLAKQIKNLRINAGMSQLQLAKKLNVGPSAVGMYEQGRRTPNIDVLIQMARFYNVSLDYLITGLEYTPSSETSDMPPFLMPCSCHKCCCKNNYRHFSRKYVTK